MSATTKETLGFQAEVKQLLQLMIHSLYSNKDIFLRELISNASDAADKLRFEGLSDPALFENDSELKIRIAFDREARTLTITDNGIGMSRQEVIEHIGTIAKSGTREFFTQLSGDQKKDAALIGQFGVGFYSAFIVADRVTLTTRRAGLTAEHGVRWESEGAGDYTLETVNKPARGTEIVLHLREGEDEFLSDWKIKSVIRTYSDHITLPILMKKIGMEGRRRNAHRRGRNRQPRLGPVGARQEGRHRTTNTTSSTSTSPTTSSRRWPGRTTGWKASRNTSRCCTCPRTRRSTSTTASTVTASSSTCAACSSWTTPSS